MSLARSRYRKLMIFTSLGYFALAAVLVFFQDPFFRGLNLVSQLSAFFEPTPSAAASFWIVPCVALFAGLATLHLCSAYYTANRSLLLSLCLVKLTVMTVFGTFFFNYYRHLFFLAYACIEGFTLVFLLWYQIWIKSTPPFSPPLSGSPGTGVDPAVTAPDREPHLK